MPTTSSEVNVLWFEYIEPEDWVALDNFDTRSLDLTHIESGDKVRLSVELIRELPKHIVEKLLRIDGAVRSAFLRSWGNPSFKGGS